MLLATPKRACRHVRLIPHMLVATLRMTSRVLARARAQDERLEVHEDRSIKKGEPSVQHQCRARPRSTLEMGIVVPELLSAPGAGAGVRPAHAGATRRLDEDDSRAANKLNSAMDDNLKKCAGSVSVVILAVVFAVLHAARDCAARCLHGGLSIVRAAPAMATRGAVSAWRYKISCSMLVLPPPRPRWPK